MDDADLVTETGEEDCELELPVRLCRKLEPKHVVIVIVDVVCCMVTTFYSSVLFDFMLDKMVLSKIF